jgi:hypothetical protein
LIWLLCERLRRQPPYRLLGEVAGVAEADKGRPAAKGRRYGRKQTG